MFILCEERVPEIPIPMGKDAALIVEDDLNIRESLVELLEEEGFRAESCANGREAMNRMRAGLRPNVILLDLVMPIMDGWDFRMEQLRDPDLKDIPVVLITAAGFRAETLQSQLKGVEFIRKPPRASDVITAVERVLGRVK